MAEHITKPEIERFSVSPLPDQRLEIIAKHLAECEACHQLLSETLRSQRGTEGLKFTLAPEFWFRHEHLDYEQLVSIADNTLDATEREIIDIHLSTCATCREDVRSFLAFREEIEPELRVRYGPATKEPNPSHLSRWRGFAWRPIYAAAVVIIGMALVIGVALLLKRRAANLEAKQNQPPQVNMAPSAQTPTPENRTATNVRPTPAPVPSIQLPRQVPSPSLTVKNQRPLKPVENAGAVAALKDETGAVTVDRVGNVSGLDEIPENQRQAIGEALVRQDIKEPAIGVELAGAAIHLRGPSEGPTFRLLSPKRTVIVSDRPAFAWEKLARASSYRVVIGDLNGHELARSEELAGDRTSWTPAAPLNRGEIYTWEVEATLDGMKVHSPGTSVTQMKFKILSASGVRELEQLKKVRSHLALGVFYAREGMVAEAEHEFQILVRDNPRVPVLKKLLKQIQSWKTE